VHEKVRDGKDAIASRRHTCAKLCVEATRSPWRIGFSEDDAKEVAEDAN